MAIDWVGDIDIASVDEHRARIEQLIDTGLADSLSLDLAGVSFIDSTGLALLMHVHKTCSNSYIDLSLRGVTPMLRQLLTVTGLLSLFVIEYGHPHADSAMSPRRLTPPATSDPTFDRIAQLTARLLDVGIAAISFVARDGEVLPGAVSMREPRQSLRTSLFCHSLCQHVVSRAAEVVVPDLAADPSFADEVATAHTLHVAAYAGTPITDADGRIVGALCAIDDTPRDWDEGRLANLRLVAGLASVELVNRAAADRAFASAEQVRAAQVAVTHHLLAAGLVLTRGLAVSSGAVARDIRQAIDHTEAALSELRTGPEPMHG